MASPLVAVCSEIGRGHPQYLDSVLDALGKQGIADIPRFAPRWPLARLAYRLGARGGPLTSLYTRFRAGRPSPLLLRLLDESLRRRFRDYPGLLLVDHPLLAHLLGPVCRVVYIHGEIAAPSVAAVPSAWRTLVPLESAADGLVSQGVERETLSICGLFIEPGLAEVAKPAGADRLERLVSDRPLTIAFFTSGAYPRPHLRLILAALRSCLDAGQRAVLLCGPCPRIEQWYRYRLGARTGLTVLSARTRQEENARTLELFPNLDLMVAPAHERTNWAVGLGLPMFILEPDIGPFAPLNREHALKAGVARPLGGMAGARIFGSTVSRLIIESRLAAMVEAGRNRHPVNGAETAALSLAACVRSP